MIDLVEGVENPLVGRLQPVLHDEPGFNHVAGVRHGGGHHASQAACHDGSPVGNVAQLIHEKGNEAKANT